MVQFCVVLAAECIVQYTLAFRVELWYNFVWLWLLNYILAVSREVRYTFLWLWLLIYIV